LDSITHQIGHQVIVADDFALLFPVVLPNHAFPTKGHPLHELVPRFNGIGGGGDGPTQLLIIDKLEEEDGPDDPTEFPKDDIEPILAAFRTELAQNGRGANLALAD
jgi:hypothetical protein